MRNIQWKVHNKLKQNESKAHFTILQQNQVGILSETQGCFNLWKSRNLRMLINQMKIEQDMTLLIVPEQECVSIPESVSWFRTPINRKRRNLPQPNKRHKRTSWSLTYSKIKEWKFLLCDHKQGKEATSLLCDTVLEYSGQNS